MFTFKLENSLSDLVNFHSFFKKPFCLKLFTLFVFVLFFGGCRDLESHVALLRAYLCSSVADYSWWSWGTISTGNILTQVSHVQGKEGPFPLYCLSSPPLLINSLFLMKDKVNSFCVCDCLKPDELKKKKETQV